MGSRDHIGLWRFSTRLEGNRDYQPVVPLGPVRRQRQPVLHALDGIKATSGDTGLYDTIIAGVTHLHERGGGAGDANALILVTDGEKNDDPTGGATLDDVIDHLRGRSQVHAFLLVFGPAACGKPAFTALTNRTDTVCLDAGESGLDRAFDQVSATLWGTDRP
jgi:von Willebrand factor type A domain